MSRPTVLITGASQGSIGDALARQFAQRGYHVFAALRNLSKAAHFKSEKYIDVVTPDVTSPKAIQDLAADLKNRLPNSKLDILVNNAGIGATGPLIEVDLATARQL